MKNIYTENWFEPDTVTKFINIVSDILVNGEPSVTFDTNEWNKGVYMIQMIDSNNTIKTQKVVVIW